MSELPPEAPKPTRESAGSGWSRSEHDLDAVVHLARGISQSLRNHMTVVLGNAQLLTSALSENENERQLLAELNIAAEAACELVDRLTKISEAKTKHHEVIDLTTVLQNLEGKLSSALVSSCDLTLTTSGPAYARIGRDEITEAIEQLCINACEAMPTGGSLEIDIITEPATVTGASPHDTDPQIVLTVTDNGVGIDSDHVNRVFYPFFSTKSGDGPFGLGLTFVDTVVRRAGGAVEVRSRAGEGTTLELRLPAAKA